MSLRCCTISYRVMPIRVAQRRAISRCFAQRVILSTTFVFGQARGYSSCPRIPQKRLQTQEETPRKRGDTLCNVVFDVYYHPVFSESLLGFGVSSGEFWDHLCCVWTVCRALPWIDTTTDAVLKGSHLSNTTCLTQVFFNNGE